MESVGFFIHMVRLCGVVLVQLGYSLLRLVAVCARVRFHLNLLEEKSMKMKLNALSLAVAAGFIGSAAQAADVAMFPYVVNSPTVTTIVSIVDNGTAATQRYNNAGVIGNIAGGSNRLHYRLNYKAGALAGMDAASRAAQCQEVNYYLPSSPSDIQTFDLGGRHSTAAARGVMFNDASINNNYVAGTTATINYMLGANAGSVQRGTLFIHNADTVVGQTLYGEAMVLDFSTGAAWGYQALLVDEGAGNTAAGFAFNAQATNAVGSAPDILTFMPAAEVTTRLFVTPVRAVSMLAADGASVAGWDQATSLISMATGAGVAFDRDENLVSGSAGVNIKCVGAIDHTELMTAGAAAVLANGGHGLLTAGAGTLAAPAVGTADAVLTKLEFSRTNGGTLNGVAVPGTYNNGFIMR